MKGEIARPERILPPMVGDEMVPAQPGVSGAVQLFQPYAVDTFGSTTYDWQYNACAITRIVYDPGTNLTHVVWTWSNICGNDAFPDRQVYYNCYDPAQVDPWICFEGMDAGCPVQTERAGYATMDINSSGSAVVALHRAVTGYARASVGVDLLPGFGVFSMYDVCTTPVYVIWPRVAVDKDDNMVVVVRNAEEGADDAYYSVSDDGGQTWTCPYTFLDSISSVSQNAFGSKQSNSLVMMWTKELAADRYNDHLYYQLSTDGGQSWGRPRDVTACIEVPPGHAYEWWQMRSCLWGGAGMFDADDQIHMVFSATMAVGEPGYYYPYMSTAIWHYNPDAGCHPITLYPSYWTRAWSTTFGNTQIADKPSIAQDPATEYFYCVWLEYPYDQNDPGNTAYPVGELYAARSMDGGATWGPKVNLTMTPQGCEVFPHFASAVNDTLHVMYEYDLQSASYVQATSDCTDNPYHYLKVPVIEGDVEVVSIDDPPHWGMGVDTTTFSDNTYTPKVTYRNAGAEPASFQAKFEVSTPVYIADIGMNAEDTLFSWASLQYGIVEVADLAAGATIQVSFPAWTCSTWMSGYWAHYRASACLLGDENISNNSRVDSCIVDSVDQYEGVHEIPVVSGSLPLFLSQNYPNPVISKTTIQYQLPQNGKVSLAIYDCNGRLIKTLASGYQSKGIHEATWDGRDQLGEHVSGGVYFYRLLTVQGNRSQKLVLID